MQPVDERKNPAIADVVEACRVRLRRGETIEACLADYPARRDELAVLLPVAVQAQKLAHDPDPIYAAGARRRFRASVAAERENREREAARARGPLGWLRRLAVPLMLVLALSASGLGLVQASEPALPDSPLYTVKQASENVGQVFARTPQQTAQVQIGLTNRRLSDLQLAVKEEKAPTVVDRVANNMVDTSDTATTRVLSNQGPNRAAQIAQLRTLLAKQRAGLNAVANSPHPPLARSAQNLQQRLLADEKKLAAAEEVAKAGKERPSP